MVKVTFQFWISDLYPEDEDEFVRRGWFEVVLGLWFEGTFRFVVAVVVVSFCTLGSD